MAARRKRAKETLEILARLKAEVDPDLETIAELHEIHARHEREAGREENALRADARAAHARARAAEQSPRVARSCSVSFRDTP